MNKTNEWKKEFIKKSVDYFNNAFTDGEDGEELRNEHLAEEYAESMWENLIQDLLTKQHQQHTEEMEGIVSSMSGWFLDYVPTSWQDKDEDPEFIVKQDLLTHLKDK